MGFAQQYWKTWAENNIAHTLQKTLFQANQGWLEPLLARVSESSSNVVTPVGNMITIIITLSLVTLGHTGLSARFCLELIVGP